jgi:glycyl-tRNA synthetase beta chain
VANIQEKAGGAGAEAVDPSFFAEDAERLLLAEVERVERESAEATARRDYPAVLRAVAALKPAVDRFFDEVMVMADDPLLRDNRLALVRRVAGLFAGLADFRKIQVEAAGKAG